MTEGDPGRVAATHWSSRWNFDVDVELHVRRGERVIVLRHGEVDGPTPPLVRLHSACLTSEVLGSTRCDCNEQLELAMERIGQEKAGILLYFPDHEGRGIGIAEKLKAYALQDQGENTTDANTVLGHPVDARDFGAAVDVLKDLGVHQVRLMTNNPDKLRALEEGGITVHRVSAWAFASNNAASYLEHKVNAMSHLL